MNTDRANEHRKDELASPASETDSPSVLTVIRRIQSGALDPQNLSTATRRDCVEHLTGEGYSVTEIAEILKVSGRTIARDRQAIRAANAVKQDPELVAQMVGRLLGEAELVVSRLRRITRDSGTLAAVKVEAEWDCWRVIHELTGDLQKLGYLPSAAQQIRADLTHHLGDVPGMQMELNRLRVIQRDCLPGDCELAGQLDRFQRLIQQLPNQDPSIHLSDEHTDDDAADS